MLDSPDGGVIAMSEQVPKTIDEQFHDVSIAFAESRDFTEFCFTKLESRVDQLDAKVDGLALTIDRRFTHHGLLLSEILNEVKAISRATRPDPHG